MLRTLLKIYLSVLHSQLFQRFSFDCCILVVVLHSTMPVKDYALDAHREKIIYNYFYSSRTIQRIADFYFQKLGHNVDKRVIEKHLKKMEYSEASAEDRNYL